jgi:hypothetical protein
LENFKTKKSQMEDVEKNLKEIEKTVLSSL